MPQRTLQAENLHFWRSDRHVLRGVGFSLAAGDCLQVTGANGAGKTTLLRLLCGLAYPEEGRVTWSGVDVRHDLRSFQGELAYIGHEPPLKSDLSARENLRYWVGVRRTLTGREIDEALVRVGAGQWHDRPVRTLSAGQKRRVALAGLTLTAAPLWLLDEPTTNLDSKGQALVGELIEEHLAAGGLTVAAIHHDLPLTTTRVCRLELAS
jgi:heme exporter protein A